MYIPYETIGNLLYKITKSKNIKDFFYNKKISQNVAYIEKNKPIVQKKLYRKLKKHQKIKVVFYVYDETKWKCQALYDLLSINNIFQVKILVTRNAVHNKDNPSYQTLDDIKKTYTFFKNKGLNVELAYDLEFEKHVPFKKFQPDIIFYQHPWYVETSQGPVVCSKFALTYYIPYYFPIETAEIDYGLRFHKYVETYCVLNDYLKHKYETLLNNNACNIKALGYPFLDLYRTTDNKSEYVIYAPHWTVADKGLAYGTFEWSGKFILDYAKNHPEIKWVFKPHPMLYKALIDNKMMTPEEVEEYYSQWGNIGLRYESGDYLKLFAKSKMMITDCSSFLGEFFLTGKPLIHLMSQKSQFRNSDNPILKTFYRAENLDELKDLLDVLPQNDSKKDIRNQILNESKLTEFNSSEKIIIDICELIENWHNNLG